METRLQECIRLCLECHRECLEAVSRLSTSAPTMEVAHIQLLFGCAELCRTSAGLLRAGADVSGRTAAACAEVCERSAELCEALGGSAMTACAEACRLCAEACRQEAALAA
jgi:hypothetical protein